MKRLRIINLILISITMIVLSMCVSVSAADYYESWGTNYYFAPNNPYFRYDYALVTCDDFGGSFEDTDFMASTNGKGSDVYSLTKVASVHVWFYDADGEETEGTDSCDIPYYEDGSQSAVVYGSDHVNNEYGLDMFTSRHEEYLFDSRYVDPETGMPYEFDFRIIYIDTTGYYR